MRLSKTKKVLMAASALSVLMLSGNIISAQESASDGLETPTLTRLNAAGQTMPNGLIYPESSYTLTRIENADASNLPANTIVKYIINEDRTLTPQYFQVLVPAEYGEGQYSQRFGWELDAKGNNAFKLNPSNASTEVRAKYDTQKQLNRINNTSSTMSNYEGTIFYKSGYAMGSAIYNTGKLGKLSVSLISNNASSATAAVYGGAIYNKGNTSDITGTFANNYTNYTGTSTTTTSYGGAIYNFSTAAISGDIVGDFLGNYAKSSTSISAGGAIYNMGAIDNIRGNFIGNYSYTSSAAAVSGGALFNASKATIKDITGSFIGNYVYLEGDRYSKASGGAIYMQGNNNAGNLTGDFIGNYAFNKGNAYGGAIYNNAAQWGNMAGDFIGNYAMANDPYGGGDAYGGALANYSKTSIGDITGDFIGNYASVTKNYGYGGAIYAEGGSTIKSVTGDFIGNNVKGVGISSGYKSDIRGGAIYQTGSSSNIGDITGNFINNYLEGGKNNSIAYGGAIGNEDGKIGNITGHFIGNYADALTGGTAGGAIYNSGPIASLTGDFVSNHISGVSNGYGGAIYNNGITGSIGDIKGNFKNNYVLLTPPASNFPMSYGGAIYNGGNIKSITGDFENNSAVSITNGAISGGAIYNGKKIDIITGNFKNNYAESKGETFGGAILNTGTMSEIKGNFDNNHVNTVANNTSYISMGGAVANNFNAIIGKITGDFTNNYSQALFVSRGGAIANRGNTINIVDSSFRNNYVIAPDAKGGAIYANIKSVTNIIADKKDVLFEGNYTAGSIDGERASSAIYLEDTATLNLNASGDGKIIFNDKILSKNDQQTININQVGTSTDDAAPTDNKLPIWAPNTGEIVLNNDMSDFLGKVNVYGGTVKIGKDGKFFENSVVSTYEGSMINAANGKIDNIILGSALTINGKLNIGIDADLLTKAVDGFQLNSAEGAIHIKDINLTSDMAAGVSNFTSEELVSGDGSFTTTLESSLSTIVTAGSTYDVVLNDNKLTFVKTKEGGSLTGAIGMEGERTYIMNEDENIVAWNNELKGDTLVVKGNSNSVIGSDNNGLHIASGQTVTVENVGNVSGGVVGGSWSGFNSTEGGAFNNSGTLNLIDSSVTGNTTTGNGGAIHNDGGSLNIGAVNGHSVFEGNSANGESSAIHNNNGTVNINAYGGNNVIFNDKITSENADGSININGSKADNAASGFDVAGNGTVVLNHDMSGYSGDVNFYHGTIKIGADGIFFENAKNFNVYGCALDLSNGIIQHTSLGNVNISNTLDIIADADLANSAMDTISATNTLSDAGKIDVTRINLISEAATTQVTINFADASVKDAVTYSGGDAAYSPIYKYHVAYDANNGDFTFDRFESSGYESFNPALFAAPIAAQLGGYLNQLNTYDQAFNNVDMYMIKSEQTRNLEALSAKAKAKGNKKAFDRANRAIESYTDKRKSIWIKPFAVFEDVELNEGPKVSNDSYGTLVGIDTGMAEYTNGFNAMLSLYAGYLGSRQSYDTDNKITQNGGLVGLTGAFYKGGFYTAITANIGASMAESETMYGKDDFTMLTAGIASKTGFNIELGRFILQPNAQISYTLVNSFDYTNNADIKINSDALSAVQVSPGVKAIAALSKGWQAYISGAMVWNLLDESKVTANSIGLPEMSVDSYAIYGIGIQKNMINRLSAFAQVMKTSGGRDGIDGKLGLNLAI